MALIDSITGSIWFYECQAALSGGNGHVHAHASQNPELWVLFFRLAELSRSTVQAVFVFDGPRRPKIKRGKAVRTHPHWLISQFKQLVRAFGFHCHDVGGIAVCICMILLIKTRLLVKLKPSWLT